MHETRRSAERYGLAVAAVGATLLLRFATEPVYEGRGGLIVFILPVALAAWAGGLGPGLVATAASTLLGLWFFVPPVGSFAVRTVADVAYTTTFIAAGCVVSALANGLRQGRERAETNAFRAERLQAVAAALAGELSAQEAAEAVLREGIVALGAGQGVISLLDPGGRTLSIVASVGYDRSGWERFAHYPVDEDYPVSEAVRLHEPIAIDGAEDLRRRYPRLGDAIHEGGSAVVVPLLDKSGPVGGLYYRFAERRPFDARDREYLLALGRLCAAALERARLHDLERRAGERAAFLASASAVLAGSLDFETTVRQVAELVAPNIADYCSVHLLEPDGTIRTLALAGDADRMAAAERWLEISPPRLDDPVGIGAVVREGRPYVARVTDELLASVTDARIREAAEALDGHDHVAVPLTVHGRTVGAIALTTTRSSGRTLGPDEATLAEEIAWRAALAIENSRLYSALVARESQQAAVARLGQLAVAEPELQPLLNATVLELSRVLDVELATVLRLDADRSRLTVVAGIGWPIGVVGHAGVPAVPESQAGYTLTVGGPVIVDDLATDARFGDATLFGAEGVVSGMSAAIHGHAGAWGVLAVHSSRRRSFTEDDTNFLVAVTNVLAGAIERRRRLDEERAAQELNRAFIGIVSHELRTPITTIYGGAKMLSRIDPGDPDHASIASDVEAEAERLYRLTEDLLVMTRLERHDLEVAREPLLLSRLLERIVDSERRRWALVDIRLDVVGDLDPVGGEDNYVEQVVRNLVGNAAKYSPAGSTIEVRAEPEADGVAVRVLDEGPGIRGEDPDRLFALFYRAPSTAQQASGAGIGLFVCNQLVNAMGGRLWARPREGSGSEFGFWLARYADADDATGPDPLREETTTVAIAEAARDPEAVSG